MKIVILTLLLVACAVGGEVKWQSGKIASIDQERFGATRNGGLMRLGGDKAIVYVIESPEFRITAAELSMAHHAFKPERFRTGDSIRFSLNDRKGKVSVIDPKGSIREFDMMKKSAMK